MDITLLNKHRLTKFGALCHFYDAPSVYLLNCYVPMACLYCSDRVILINSWWAHQVGSSHELVGQVGSDQLKLTMYDSGVSCFNS